ncbi:hypothetical protein EN792_076470 [Mesorhizobium sp. M00.F.Ca.ET.149.01.1.1]|nr:hypothetical protein EN792_076470 [Mesorhizobium sp. M00.F.Ca.ET.149.01.1.1]
MTTATPLARYGAVEGALASGFATAERHNLWRRDPADLLGHLSGGAMGSDGWYVNYLMPE